MKDRKEKRWGSRVVEGGDMFEQQRLFRNQIAGLTEEKVADSIGKIGIDVIQLNGTLPVQKNVEIIIRQIL